VYASLGVEGFLIEMPGGSTWSNLGKDLYLLAYFSCFVLARTELVLFLFASYWFSPGPKTSFKFLIVISRKFLLLVLKLFITESLLGPVKT